jgi:dihydrofolate reductase
VSRISLIAAVARNRAIGRDKGLAWLESADQAHFRDTTRGHAVVMGRKTWESLPAKVRPLPGRHNVVVTRNQGFTASGADTVHSLEQALALLRDVPEVFVIGGAQLYAQALPLAHRLVLTEVDADLPGDTFFPVWPREQFDEVARHSALSAAGVPYAFVTYQRRRASTLPP